MGKEMVVVAGGGGFIGGALVSSLRIQGVSRIRSVDITPSENWHQIFPDVENLCLDLSVKENCHKALEGASMVYNLAADMGGMGFIENNKTLCNCLWRHEILALNGSFFHPRHVFMLQINRILLTWRMVCVRVMPFQQCQKMVMVGKNSSVNRCADIFEKILAFRLA
jgi:hypothetical protein